MTDEIRLKPLSRPDRKYLWVRFKHPITRLTIRADLGSDRAVAREICKDIEYILRSPKTWKRRSHQDLDGLNERAVAVFFNHLDSVRLKLNFRKLEKSFELIWQRLGKSNYVRPWTAYPVATTEAESSTPSAAMKADEYQYDRDMIFRYACRDGTVAYCRGTKAVAILDRHLNEKYGQRQCTVHYIGRGGPSETDLPELHAIFGKSDGSFSVPDGLEDPPRRWKCIYRLCGPDRIVQYADGAIAFDRLFKRMRTKFRFKDVEFSVELADSLSLKTVKELHKLYGTHDGKYEIPFPKPAPLQRGPASSCPLCESRRIRIVQWHRKKAGYERKCLSCGNLFITQNKTPIRRVRPG